MTDKITLPMDVSKGIQFDFTVEGITEEQAKDLLNTIIEQIKTIVPDWGNVFAGGYVSVAHMEELEQEHKEKEERRIKELIDLYRSGDDDGEWLNDDIPLDELEQDEDETCIHGKLWYLCNKCGNEE